MDNNYNEYDDLIQNKEPNEYDSLLQSDKQMQKSQVQNSVYVAAQGVEPDQKAEVMKLSQKLDLPPNIVERNFADLKKKQETNLDYDELIASAPGTSNFLADPTNAALAKDDIDHLKKLEGSIKDQSLMDDLHNAVAAGMFQVGASLSRAPGYLLYNMATLPTNVEAAYTGEGQQIPVPEGLKDNALAQWFDKKSQEYSKQVSLNGQSPVELATKGDWGKVADAAQNMDLPELGSAVWDALAAGEYEKAGRAAAIQFAQNLPNQAALIASAMTGYGELGLLTAGLTTGAEKLKEMTGPDAKSQVSPMTAQGVSLLHGTFESAFESLGTFGLLKQWESAIAKEYGRTASKEMFKDFLKTLSYSAAGEGNEELWTSVAQDLTDKLSGYDPKLTPGQIVRHGLDAGIVGAISGVGMTAPMGALHGYRQVRQAQETKQFYLALGEDVKESKLFKRMPEKAQEALEKMTEGTPVEDIFIPVSAFNQSPKAQADGAKLMQSVGILKEYEEALETGKDIQIPLAKWVAKVVGTPEYQALADHVKFKADGQTVYETLKAVEDERKVAEEIKAQVSELLNETAQELGAPVNQEGAQAIDFEKEAREAVQPIREQLKAIGRDQTFVDAFEAQVRTISQRVGISPLEFMKRFELKVNSTRNAQMEQTLNQDGQGFVTKRENETPVDLSKYSDTPVVTVVPTQHAPYTPGNLAKNTGTVVNKHTGFKISVNADTEIKAMSLSRGMSKRWAQEHLEMLQHIKDIAENGVYLSQAPEGKGDAKTKGWHYIFGRININGQERLVRLDVEEKARGGAMHVHSYAIVDPSGLPDSGARATSAPAYNPQGTTTSIGQFKQLVNAARNKFTFFQSAPQVDPLEAETGVPAPKSLAPAFYSKLIQHLEEKMPNRASPQEVKALIKDIKEEERKWSGIDDFLKEKEKAGEKVLKQELLDYLDANQIELKEVTKGYGNTIGLAEAEQAIKENKNVYDAVSQRGPLSLEDLDAHTDSDRFVIGGEGTKFSKYTLPGGKNYREVLFILKPKDLQNFKLSGEDKDISTWKSEERASFRQLPRTEVEANPEYAKAKKALAKKIKAEHKDMKPKAIGEFIDHTMRGSFSGVEGVSGASPELLSEIKKVFELYKKLQSPFPKETLYKKDVNGQRFMIVDTHTEDRGVYISDEQRSNKDKKYANIEEALSGLEQYIQNTEERKRPDVYKSGHWDETNVLAHMRVKEFIDADGKRVLHLEEDQSDWLQDGRKYGYKTDIDEKALRAERSQAEDQMNDLNKQMAAITEETRLATNEAMDRAKESHPNDYIKEYKRIVASPEFEAAHAERGKRHEELKARYDEASARFRALTDQISQAQKSVPDAPLKKTWHEMVFKRFIRMAAEEGFDRVTWTTGEQQAERYDISKQIDSIEYRKRASDEPNEYLVSINLTHGDGAPKVYTDVELEATIGKELTQKIIESAGEKTQKLKDLDLKVGGEGMKGFYDKILVDFAKKFGKKYGATVGETILADAEGTKVHSLDITPELREAALYQGFTLFQRQGDAPRGQIQFTKGETRQFNISLFKDADASTFIHETGHYFLEVMADLAQEANAPEQMKEDFAKILKFLNVNSREEIGEAQHELWARATEEYFLEGKAPAKGLRKIFARFKVWLTTVYRGLKNNNVELSDEVRGVMDRMIATDEEIEAYQREYSLLPLFHDPKAAGLSEDDAINYQSVVDDAKLAAKEQMQAKLMKEFKEQHAEFYKAQREEMRAEIEAQVSAQPIYKAIEILKNGIIPGQPNLELTGEQFKLSRAELKEFFDPDVVKKLPKGITTKEDGMSIEVAAELLGFKSGADLVIQLSQAEDKRKLIERMTDEKMKQKFGDLLQPKELERLAEQAVHNKDRSELLALELKHLASNNLQALKGAIRKVARRVPTVQQVREQAEKMVAEKALSDLKAYLFKRAEVKAAKEAGQALAKGDIEGAFEAKRKELLNHEIYRAIETAQEEMAKAQKLFKKFSQDDEKLSKSRDMDLVNAGRAILAFYGIGKKDKPLFSYLEPIKKYDPEVYETIRAVVDANLEATTLDQMSFERFQELHESLKAIWDLSKMNKQIEIDGKMMNREEVQSELQGHLLEITGPKKEGYQRKASTWDEVKMKLLGMRAAMRRVEHWVEAVDGGPDGPFRKYIWQPMSDAVDRYKDAKAKVIRKYLNEVLKPNELALSNRKKILSPELNYEFDGKQELLAALLHTGNESNLRKLLLGRNWGTENADGSLDSRKFQSFIQRMWADGVLTKADYDYVQGVWDLNEELKPLAQKAHKRMYGHYFSEITANEIQTPFGTYRGGYVPAVVDQMLSQDAAIRDERDMLENNNNSFMFPTTGKGFTMKRVEYNAPLALNLALVPMHIDKVLRFAYIEPHAKEVGRIVIDKSFRKVLEGLDPTIASDMLMPWLQRTAQQRVTFSSQGWAGKGLDTIAKALRKRAGLGAMTLNLVNALQQFPGLVVAMSKVKPKHIRSGFLTYLKGRAEVADMIAEKSLYMKNKLDDEIHRVNQAIEEITVNTSKLEDASKFMERHAYILQQSFQNIIDLSVWSGAYEQAIEQGQTELEAVRFADSVVRTTQDAQTAESVSRFETGTPFHRAFTMFSGYFNQMANLNGTEYVKTMREFGLRKGAGRLAYAFAMIVMIPAVMGELLVRAASGKGFDEDDDDQYIDDFLAIFFGSQFRYMTAMFPVVGPTINATVNRFNSKQYDDRISTSPAISAIESTVAVPKDVYDAIHGKLKKQQIRDILTAVTMLTGVPVQPLGKPLGYLADVSEGKAKPSGPIDVTRGLITGQPGQSR